MPSACVEGLFQNPVDLSDYLSDAVECHWTPVGQDEAGRDQPAEPEHCGALADAPWLLRIAPRGRCPFPGGGWSRRNRASRGTEVSGGRSCVGDAWGLALDYLALQLQPRAAVARPSGCCGQWKREKVREYIAIGNRRFRAAGDGNDVEDPRNFSDHDGRRRAARSKQRQRESINRAAWKGAIKSRIVIDGDCELCDDVGHDCDDFFVKAALILLVCHAAATFGVRASGSMRYASQASVGPGSQHGGVTSRRERYQTDNMWKSHLTDPTTLAVKRCGIGGGRWAETHRRP